MTLARPSDQITLLEVVKAIDGLHCTDDCLLDIPGCSSAQSCSLHEDWGDLRRRLHEILGSRTIDAFAEELDELGHMLK